jgi:hypothetical protein
MNDWTYFELAKLAVDLLTPLIVVWLGFMVKKHFDRMARGHKRSDRLVDARIKSFDEMAPLLNSLYQYYVYVGEWKNLTPVDVIETKRRLDSLLLGRAPLFGRRFLRAWKEFEDALFQTYSGKGEPAKLKTDYKSRMDGETWHMEWSRMFVLEEGSKKEQISALYWKLMESFSREIGSDFVAADGQKFVTLKPPERPSAKNVIESTQVSEQLQS